MAKYTVVLTNHSLDTSSIDSLALNLSNILKCTVEYGYYDDFKLDDLINPNERTSEYVKLGKFENVNSKQNLYLIDLYYGIRHFVNTYVDDLSSHPLFKNDLGFLECLRDDAKLWSCSLCISNWEDEGSILNINRHSMEIWKFDILDWAVFNKYFEFKMSRQSFANLIEWRKNHKDYIKKFGGSELIIGCFETESIVVFNKAYEQYEWEELKNMTKRVFGNKCLNVSDFITSNRTDDLHPYLHPYYNGEKFEFYSVEKDADHFFNHGKQNPSIRYEIFYDNFGDL